MRSKTALVKWYEDEGLDPHQIRDIEIKDGMNMDSVYQTVNKYLVELINKGIDVKRDVLIDVTAGTAAITAGLTMAALANGCNLTYQATTRDDKDNLIGKTTWQFFRNRVVQIWESFPND